MVPPVSHRVSRVQRYSGSSLTRFGFRIRGSHPLWPAFPCRSPKLSRRCAGPQPRRINPPVWPLPISLATTFGISLDFFSSPYLDVSVQAVPLAYLCVQYTMLKVCFSGLLHSDIHGSMPACGSPWLFAARCVLHRLPVPRHSPCALCSLTCLVSHVFLIILRYFSSFALMAFAISLFSLTFASVPRRFL